MTSATIIHQQWLGNIRGDVLSGTVVALALIPEAIAFSIIAGVDPAVGLYASFCIAVVVSIFGGRPGMISAATGAMALVVVTLVRDHGLQYLLAATVLTGIIQVVLSFLRAGSLMRFVSKPVVTGFVNALAILIFMAQLPEITGVTWHVYALVVGGLAVIYLLPRLTRVVPSPLVAIVVVTVVSLALELQVRSVGDMGSLPSSLPQFLIPSIPFTFETLLIILPYSLTLAVIGLLEAFMTASIVDDLTDSTSNKNREGIGQGVANICTGFVGGMAGCAMIGQSVINIKSGGRGRLSAFVSGVVLLVLVVFAGEWVAQIPMAALVSVMIMVSIGTFSWTSLKEIPKSPKSNTAVMLLTVVVVVLTHDLAKGVLAGVLLSGFFFAHKVGLILRVRSTAVVGSAERVYHVVGQVFFASADRFVGSFDYKEVVDVVYIDLTAAHFWDLTAVDALDKVVLKFRREGTTVQIRGLNEASSTLVDRFAMHDKLNALDEVHGH